jgi:hypothetical protein
VVQVVVGVEYHNQVALEQPIKEVLVAHHLLLETAAAQVAAQVALVVMALEALAELVELEFHHLLQVYQLVGLVAVVVAVILLVVVQHQAVAQVVEMPLVEQQL